MLARAKQITRFRPLQLTQNDIQVLVKPQNSSLMSKLKSRQFLDAVQSKDVYSICQILKRLQNEEKDRGNPYPISLDSAYFRCLDMLFEFNGNSTPASSRSIIQFLHFITSYRPILHIMTNQCHSSEQASRVLEFKKNILVSMIKSLRDVSDPKYRASALEKYIKTIKLLQIDCDKLLPRMDLESRKHFQKVFNYPGDITMEATSNIKNDTRESMTLNDLLGVIQDRFPTDHEGKMYEIYDKLSGSEREIFMDRYLHFNTEKQHVVEQNCQLLTLDLSNKRTKYLQPSELERKMVNWWLERFLLLLHYKLNGSSGTNQKSYVYDIINKDSFESDFNTSDLETNNESNSKTPSKNDTYWVNKHLAIFKVIPTKELFSLAVSTIMEKCQGGSLATLTNAASSCAPKMVRLCKRYGFNTDGFLDHDEFLQCLITILSILVDSCEFLDSGNQVGEWEINNPYAATLFKHSRPFHIYNDRKDSKTYSTIKIHPLVHELCPVISKESSLREVFLPMLCPPKPWISVSEGGYLRNIHSVVFSTHQKTHLEFYKKAEQTGQMSTVLSTITRLGNVPWMINSDIGNVFNAAMGMKSGFLSIPPKDYKETLSVPELPVLNSGNFSTNEAYKEAKKKVFKQYMDALNKFNGLHGKRTKYENLQKLVEAFSINGDILYMPYGFDFRGRIYPMNNYLSHYDEDLTRSLLKFWRAEPLGSHGFNWLKYQLAGVYGQDKLPFEARIAFVDNNIENILDSTKDPLKEGKWWIKGEKPWSTLSLCFEVANVIQYVNNGGKAEDFKSRIPISMDGSCNGLQHYAALGADKEGGEAVNLLPDRERQDVYTAVLQKVTETLESNIKSNLTTQSYVNEVLLRIVSRKIVKQTVMTSVYGVTKYGAKRQIQDKIDSFIDSKDVHYHTLTERERVFLENNRSEIASHLANITLKSIASMFEHAKDIQNWLMLESTKLMKGIDKESFEMTGNKQGLLELSSVHSRTPMLWTTMTGFPVVQLYNKISTHTLYTSRGALKIASDKKLTEVDRLKQINGIAPNFIHSVDATHMQMACFEATERNLTFVSVHDSFWTYPKDVDTLNSIIRQTFVTLHSEDILRELYLELNEAVQGKYQLVYYNIRENELFYEEIQNLRLQYPGLVPKLNRNFIKKCLMYEFELFMNIKHPLNTEITNDENLSEILSTERLFIEKYLNLIKLHRPKLFLRISAGRIVPYDSNARLTDVIDDPHFKSDGVPKTWSMLVVPLIVLNYPEKGELDISGVLNNKYFFS